MNVLFICSGNNAKISPFITDQAFELEKIGVKIFFFTIQGKGIWGYLKNLNKLKKQIIDQKIDLIHAHYGLSGLFASLQRKVPLVITFHGSDIHQSKNRFFSKLAIRRSDANIFVSEKLKMISKSKSGYIIPCGVDTTLFYARDLIESRIKLNLSLDKYYVLFSSAFTNTIKNSELAIQSVQLIQNCELIELKDFTRENVAILMNAVNVCLMTSFDEGSPQFIKEALASGRPIVSTNIGDVAENFGPIEGCFLTSFETRDCATKIQEAINFSLVTPRTNGPQRIIEKNLDAKIIANQIKNIYIKLLNQ